MNETERRITRHLQHLADDAPDADLVAAARADAPARRTWVMPGLVAAAVVVLVAVGALVVPRGGDDGEPVVAGPTTAPPTAPAGQRLVGRGGLVVSVPSGWPIDDVSCGSPERGDLVVVSGSGFERSCLRGRTEGSVEVAVGPPPDVTAPGATERVVDGYRVTQSESTSPTDDGITLALRSPDAGASFVLTGPAARVRAVADTLRAVPEGYAVVPSSDESALTPTRSTIRAQLEAAGFGAAFREPIVVPLDGRGGSPDWILEKQAEAQARQREDALAELEGRVVDPPPGTLARIGTTITLTVG